MKVIVKDLLTVEEGIICHQCNCRGSMGAGIARSIKNRWRSAYEAYMSYFRTGKMRLGDVVLIEVEPGLSVAHVMGQDMYGSSKHCWTDYNAVQHAFEEIRKIKGDRQVYIPYGMGCGLAGGDWDRYSMTIDGACPGVIACKVR